MPRLLTISLSVLFCDQIAKLFIQRVIPSGSSLAVIKNIFHLTLVYNKGAAFGIFKSQTFLFTVLGIACAIFAFLYLPRIKREPGITRYAFALILGGILGNLIDRLRFGYVIDFLDFRVWPVFNIADSAITIGALLICIQILKPRKKAKICIR
ncbi:MAG: signal peptidase II [Candidatus Omnitrophica bacterium]|nr:signal peptidase II [Candidatus Omnitrophota bacterium]